MGVPGLEAFTRIAECGSFRRTAKSMRLSQTALSHRIKKLEQDLGVTLFQRTIGIISRNDLPLSAPAQHLQRLLLQAGAQQQGAAEADPSGTQPG